MLATGNKERFRGKALLASGARFRISAGTTPSAMFICWGQRLLLRISGNELNGMKRPGGKTLRFKYGSTPAGGR